ncbi:hypothetical protein B5M42_004905 [Paenibacillus athensensis]|uniref:Teneurin-like YD-shell domain-containing protein n=2 Tax=Paenibacillus athensensis TaxID=1967502 RepID=A0A4Y8PV44_9BACL|nr:hypothetical protein [Paenibacillus athensensis]
MLLYNGHGDVVAVKDSSGSTLKTYEYDIWGNLTSETETMPQPFRYAGEPQDDESGLIYLRARYYDPAVARFIKEDTYTGKIDNPLSLNLYTYVENNPLTHWDPSGHGPFGRAAVGIGESLGADLGGAGSMPGSMSGAPYPIVTPLQDPEGSDPYVDKKILPNLPSTYTNQWQVDQPFIQVDQQTAKENSPTVMQQPVVDSSMYILASGISPLQNGLALSKIAGNYGNLKCVKAANAMKSYLTKNSLKGEQISIKYQGDLL